MVKEDLYLAVPSFFRCPISLEVMKSPVSLCTGVTYDRASIQRWLDSGNNTCPATMQILQTKDLIPNHTLQRLIKIWYDSVQTRSKTSSNSLLTRDQTRYLVQQIIFTKEEFQQISKLYYFAKESDENCEFLVSIENGKFVPSLFKILGKNVKNAQLACKAVELSVILLGHCKFKEFDLGNDFVSSMMFYMRQNNRELRISVAKLLESICTLGFKDKFLISQNVEIYSELLKSRELEDVEASLSCLVCLATPRRNRHILAKANAVDLLSKALSKKDLTVSLTEKVLKLLEMLSSCKEGRDEICENESCVEEIVKKVVKVSNVASEHGITIIWSLCCLLRDEKAKAVVNKSNGMGKILLLMQTNCSPQVRQMCCDLLKVFRLTSNYNSSCISTYNTKTTHIMPF